VADRLEAKALVRADLAVVVAIGAGDQRVVAFGGRPLE
jgi:hypothetical protein